MRRILLALPLAAAAAALAILAEPGPLGAALSSVISAGDLPLRPRVLAVVETSAPPTPLDAALILRATLRFDPDRVTFLDPLAGDEGRPVLDSKLADAKAPVAFAASSPGRTPPKNPIAARWVERIPFDRLMLRAERSERGEITADLDNLFRGREIAVQMAGAAGAVDLAAARNGLVETPPRPELSWVAVALAGSLPWWRGGRLHRALAALGVACAWLLLAFAIHPQSHLVLPLAAMLSLPLLALVPVPLHEIEQRKLPA